MQAWEYRGELVKPGGSCYHVLETLGSEGWEAWHIEDKGEGWREIYFKRPVDPVVARRRSTTDSVTRLLLGDNPTRSKRKARC